MNITKIFNKIRYIRSVRIFLVSILLIVMSIFAVTDKIKSNKATITSGRLVSLEHKEYYNKKRTVKLYEIKLLIENEEFKQVFAYKSKFDNVFSNLKIGDTVFIHHNDKKIYEIVNKSKILYESGFRNINIILLFLLGVGLLILVIYYLINYRDDFLK